MKIYLGFMLTFYCYSSLSFAMEDGTDRIYLNDTLEKIAKRNIKAVWNNYGGDAKEYAEDIKKWNPEIKDWEHPPRGQLIYITYPYPIAISQATWAPPLGKYEEPGEWNELISLSAFYGASAGNYTEQTANQDVTSSQNFPITLGGNFSFTNDDEKKHFVMGGFYWAQSAKSKVEGDSETNTGKISTPGELGGNFYYLYRFKMQDLGFFGGYDFEKLNTLNTSEIMEGADVKNISNQLHYGTLGLQKNFSPFDLSMSVKLSYSQIIASSTSGTKNLTGSRYMAYYTYKPTERIGISAFYKHHSLSGPTELKIDRYGLSVGILIF